MMNIIITIIIISIISNIFVNQIDPLEWFKKRIGLSYPRKLYSGYKLVDMFIYTIWKIINCPGCLSFWLSILYFQSVDGIWIGFISYALSTWMYNNIFTTKINL